MIKHFLVVLLVSCYSLCYGLHLHMSSNPFKNLFGGASSSGAPSSQARELLASSSGSILQSPNYTWDELHKEVLASEEGAALEQDRLLREKGAGSPHADNDLRLFGTSGEPRVTFYKDRASWCPYCQKVWIMLEEKKIPYRIGKINMRSYGDKPREFLNKVPNGLLPAIELDGKLQTDSIPIMLNLERTFTGPNHPKLWPDDNSEEFDRATSLMKLERQLFGDWCGLVFRPSYGQKQSRIMFEETLDVVEEQLGLMPGPFFLKQGLSIVDLQFVTHIERMLASVPYWAGFKIRGGKGSERWPNIDAWFDAFESMPSYMASKSDYYTHVQDIPPQYGPGYDEPGSGAEKLSAVINGVDEEKGWRLPLAPFGDDDVEPVKPFLQKGELRDRQEAAYKLIRNHEAVVKFAARGTGKKGAKRFQAPLADPYAEPNEASYSDVDAVLRTIGHLLLEPSPEAWQHSENQLQLADSSASAEDKRAVALCLNYLKRRVGVPRDMTYPAARQLRAHLTWAENQLIG